MGEFESSRTCHGSATKKMPSPISEIVSPLQSSRKSRISSGRSTPTRRQPPGLLVPVETRRRLVEQQQLRLGHERTADFDQPAETPRLSDSTLRSADALQAEEPEHLVCPVPFVAPTVRRADSVLEESAVAAASPVGDEEVLTRRHPCEQLDALECAADPDRARRCVGLPTRSTPSNAIEPRAGRNSPSRQLKNVVFPRRSAR